MNKPLGIYLNLREFFKVWNFLSFIISSIEILIVEVL